MGLSIPRLKAKNSIRDDPDRSQPKLPAEKPRVTSQTPAKKSGDFTVNLLHTGRADHFFAAVKTAVGA
jgi:hypothetical protein